MERGRHRGRHTFHRQLTRIVVIGITVLALAASLATAWHAGRQIRAYLIESAMGLAATVAQESVVALLTGSPEYAAELTQRASRFPDVAYVAVYGRDGARVIGSGEPVLPQDPSLWTRPASPDPVLVHETPDYLQVVAPVIASEDTETWSELQAPDPHALWLGTVVLTVSKQGLQAMTVATFRNNLLVAVAVAAVLLAALLLVSRRVTGPLRQLARIMADPNRHGEALATGQHEPAEIAAIRAAYAAMRRTIEQRDQALREHAEQLETMVEARTRELVEARDSALAASRAKSRFLASMSHELRTPLNSVIVLSDMLQRPESLDRQQEYANVIQTSAMHLLGLIDRILDLARAESGKLALSEEPFATAELLGEVEAILAPQAAKRALRWVLEQDPALPPWLLGDAARLRQVLVNLAGNAVKFTERGQVTVRCRLRDIDSRRASLRFEVEDTGIGIPADRLERIFEAFEQEATGPIAPEAGAGLGLAIARQLVEGMGGRIQVTSTPGKGSCFQVELALAIPAPGTLGQARFLAPAGSGPQLRVLVAEDDATNRYVLEQLLHAAGHRPVLATDGGQALAILTAGGIDLALLDYRMPALSGVDVAREWRRRRGHREPPLILLTAEATEEVLVQCRDWVDEVQTKPLAAEQLLATISAYGGRAPAPGRSTPREGVGSLPPPLVDLAVLNPLKASVRDGAFLPTLVRTFLKEIPVKLEAMAQALDAGDTAGFHSLVHSIQSGTGSLGAERLAQQLRRYQGFPDQDLLRHRQQVMQDLRQIFAETRQALSAVAGLEPPTGPDWSAALTVE